MAAYFRARELAEYCAVDLVIDGRTLDLGCGEGGVNTMLRALNVVSGASHGIDIAYNELVAANRRREFTSISQADANNLPFRDECFSSVICNGVLCSIPESVDPALREINRVMEDGGKFVATVPTDQFIEVMILPKALALFSDDLAKWYVRKLNNRLPHFHTFSVAEWKNKFSENGFDVVVTRSFISSKEGHIWNILSMSVFRIFGLLKLVDSERIRSVVSRVLAGIFRRISPEPAADDGKFGYLLIVAEKSAKL
jgi:ubiquinone/menaquinone biosynthesis C-methylase UbiE